MNPTRKSFILFTVLALAGLTACTPSEEGATVESPDAEAKIDVTYENYNQAETARNFRNWAKMGSNNNMLHRTELSPIGPDAPTIRMNLDTLYSVGVYDNNGGMAVTIPESDVYQSIMILDTDGYTPFFLTEPGTHQIEHDSEFLFVTVRTGIEDRHSEQSFEDAYAAQAGIVVTGNGSDPYVMPPYDQEQLHALTAEYNQAMLAAKIPFTYGDGRTPVNEEHRTWSNAAGWGGMATEVGRSNSYTTSENLPGDACYAVTFSDPGNTFFTSFTLYDPNGYLMAGETHINSYTWEPNEDGTVTIHFNCEGSKNNLSSGGMEFNYIVRNYGASQAVVDGEINPIKPMPVD
jgi:hypothetical protein